MNLITLNWKQLYRLKLTNFEVQVMFAHMVKNWFSKTGGDYNAFIKAMLDGDIEAMNAYMNRISMRIFSYFDVGKKSSQISGTGAVLSWICSWSFGRINGSI